MAEAGWKVLPKVIIQELWIFPYYSEDQCRMYEVKTVRYLEYAQCVPCFLVEAYIGPNHTDVRDDEQAKVWNESEDSVRG